MKAVQIVTVALVGMAVGHGAELPEFPFVFAAGSATTELPPQKAEISFTVKAFDATSDVALAAVKQTSANMLGFLASLSISNEDITAYAIDKDMVRERKDYQELRILGYEISRRIKVALHSLDNYEKLSLRLLETEHVERLSAVFDRDDRDRIETDLVAEACVDARRKAEQLAEGFGSAAASVHAMSCAGFGTIAAKFGLGDHYSEAYAEYSPSDSGAFDLFAFEESDSEDFVYVPSTLEFKADVNVVFRLGDQLKDPEPE
jgi:uncharacterized protein YggE